MKPQHIVTSCLILCINTLNVGGFEFFPERVPFFSASAMEFRHYLFAGCENGRLVNQGNIGVEFPVIGFSPKENRRCLAGVTAAAHLVMFPENMKFAVDNFYATLAVYANCFKSENISCRFYPVYNVSGHLGDGAKNDSLLVNARAVSSEMARFEMTSSPRTWIAFSAGYGYYYHVCAQQGLTDRFDLALRFSSAQGKQIRPYASISGQLVHLNGWRAGVDVEAGSKFVNSRGRGIGVGVRYFNMMHPGYYFDKQEKSVGVQMNFKL
jgi:hypothetical protein